MFQTLGNLPAILFYSLVESKTIKTQGRKRDPASCCETPSQPLSLGVIVFLHHLFVHNNKCFQKCDNAAKHTLLWPMVTFLSHSVRLRTHLLPSPVTCFPVSALHLLPVSSCTQLQHVPASPTSAVFSCSSSSVSSKNLVNYSHRCLQRGHSKWP